MAEVKAILAKKIENCETCDVDDQPDPEAECAECEKSAAADGRMVGISPGTERLLNVRSLIRAGYPFKPNDLKHWQWEALAEIEEAVKKHQATELEKKAKAK